MPDHNKHGGKRKGAGAKQKWDLFFKLEVGQACEELIRNSEKLAMRREKCELFESMTDLKDQWKAANSIPVAQRHAWLRSEEAEAHFEDIKLELASLKSEITSSSLKGRVLNLSAQPPYGSRKQAIFIVAKIYSLTPKQVDNMWQEYRRFEYSLQKYQT
jgi:hypothetical protein